MTIEKEFTYHDAAYMTDYISQDKLEIKDSFRGFCLLVDFCFIKDKSKIRLPV